MAKIERRRRHFINTKLQIRYLRIILIAILLPTLLFAICLYYLFFCLMAEQLGIPESIAYNIIPVFNKINLMLLFGMPIIFMAILYWGVLISHRIAGPVYRIEKELDKIVKGDFSIRIKLRKKDELISIAEGINKILDRIEGKAGGDNK